jgi:hypothetical protein
MGSPILFILSYIALPFTMFYVFIFRRGSKLYRGISAVVTSSIFIVFSIQILTNPLMRGLIDVGIFAFLVVLDFYGLILLWEYWEERDSGQSKLDDFNGA